ncbi:unnamed protein product [Durusdinium trenchii]|uniref:TauD/TfdA-like domain-containing protein n=1 Tax=Durusdinium trenchii TaxID=1381693 RepID=A0ABP0QP37_9DINO
MARFGHASRRCGQIFVQWGGSLGVGSTEATAGQLFHPLWLRLNDPSQITRNQQRLFEMSSIMDRRNSWEERLSVQWGDGAQSYYPWHWLAEHATAGAAEAAEAKQLKLEVPKHLWNQSFQSTLPRMEYEALLTRSGKLQLCTYLERYGLAFVSGLGAAEGTVKKVGNYIGHVRVTNYGAIFDVKDDGAKATNLAFTNQKISAHTDNPYRDPFPGIQMLHCLSCAGEGGATLFTDGFSVAQKLKSLDPTAFHLLSNIEHPYEYRDPDAAVLLQASVPVIKLCQGEIERITFNNRSAAPMGPEMPELERYYEAWALFDRMANSMEFTVKANLKPGDLAIWSNGRVMHGREGYERGAPRHLQGAYLDYDEIQSAVRELYVVGNFLPGPNVAGKVITLPDCQGAADSAPLSWRHVISLGGLKIRAWDTLKSEEAITGILQPSEAEPPVDEVFEDEPGFDTRRMQFEIDRPSERVKTTKRVVFYSGSVTIIWYLMHIPLVYYMIHTFAHEKQHTIAVNNSPFLLLNVDVNTLLSNLPLMVSLLNEEWLKVVDMQLHKACTRACTWLDAMDCFQPTANILPTSSTTLEMVTFGSFNVGGLSAAGSVSQDVWALLNPLMGVLPVDITYFFELTESVPWFFGQDPALAERKTNLDAHTILVNQNNHVMRSFPPGRISVTPQELLALAGWEWNLKTLLNGGEFGAVVNCYNDNHDLPPLVWANFEVVYPETRLALCLLTVEERRDASVVKVADPFIGSTFINAHVRIDAYRGNSFFRLASLAQLVVTLISFLVLLNLSTNVAVFFATYCLGPLSKIFRRAHTESFYIIYKIPSLGLALAADFLTLSKLQDAAGVSSFRSALSHEMQRILQTLAPHKPEIAPDFANHIFQKVCDTNHAVMSHLGKEGQAEQVCAYFDLHRKRHFLEWTVLPAQHRSSLRSRISRASSMALMEEDLRLPQPGTVTSNIREVKAEVDALAAESQDEKDEWIEKQREKIQTLLEQLQNVQDRLRARDAASKSYEKDVTRLLRKKDSLQRRCKQVEKQRSKLVEEIWAWRQRAIYDPNSTDTPPPTFATSSFPLSI